MKRWFRRHFMWRRGSLSDLYTGPEYLMIGIRPFIIRIRVAYHLVIEKLDPEPTTMATLLLERNTFDER